MIRGILNSIPARPVLYIAPLVMVSVLVFYYWDLKNQCTDQVSQREYFRQHVQQAADTGSLLRLADITSFAWQQVKGFRAFRPQQQSRSCPFKWDWSSQERQNIIDAGQLSVIIFIHEGSIANYIEFQSDRIKIDDFGKILTPETALFRVQRVPDVVQAYQLSLLP